MKNKITLLLLFAITSISAWAQSISFTSVPTSTPAGTSITINYKYTIASAGKVILGINLYNDWTYLSTVNYAELNPAVAGTDVAGSFTVLIPSGTTPTASLTGLQNYKINVELRDSSNNYLAVDYAQNYNFTAAVTPAVSFTAVPTSTQVGTSITINYKYTIASAGKVILGINLYNDWTYISTVNYAELNPAVAGTDVVGSFTVLIPSGTTPTASLTGLQNYKINLELKDASNNWLAGDYSVENYNFTPAPAPSVSVTSIPTSTQVGTNLVVNYKYTAAVAGKVTIGVTKNGGVNAYDYISTVIFDQLDPAVAGTDVTGTFTVLIPNGITPTASLSGNENYRVTLELKDASNNWLAGDYNTANYNFTSAATTWTGATDTSWTNASNWSAGVPHQNSNVIISAVGNQPVIASNVNINTLTIAPSASLTVNTGSNLSVTDTIENNGTLTINNNANLIQTTVSNNNSGVGTAILKRNGSTLKRLDYTLWSSPVAAQNLKAFSSLTVDPRFYTYNEGSDKFTVVANPTGTTFTPGSSFFIRMPDVYPEGSNNETPYYLGSTTLAYQGLFTGTLNNGNVPVTLTKALNGYQAVGNPYPSVIDAQTFVTANTANIENTLYFWRKTNLASGSSYATWTSGGATSVTPTSGTPNGKIQVGQGFIVQAKQAGTVANFFTNSMREAAPTSTQFFKVKQEAQKDRVWLNLTGADDVFSQTLVAYVADGSLGLDQYDGKYINDSDIALTSNIAGNEYTIQGRPAFDATDVVALNFKTSVAGTYTIAIDHADGLFSKGQDIYLVDKKVGVTTNLNEGAYNFTAEAGVDNTRFELTYQKTLKVDAPLFNENSVLVSRSNGTLNVKSNAVAINNVKVYDVQGRLVAERKNVKSNSATFSNLKANQVLIVKVTTEDNSVLSKKVLN